MRYTLATARGDVLAVDGATVAEPGAAADLTVELGTAVVRPGLINAHDHLHRNHYPRLGAPPYRNAYAWGEDIHARWGDVIERARRVDRRDALLFGALKNLVAGVTTVVHHDPWEPAFDDGFPLRVAPVRSAHSLGFDREGVAALRDGGSGPVCVHVAEGTTAEDAAEVAELERLGLLDRRLLAVHAVGMDDAGVRLMGDRGAGVVWCPTSNAFLLGRTAPRALLDAVDVLVGSDSLLTAAGTLLDELRAARTLGLLDDRRLTDAVGSLAAERLALRAPSLAPGAVADLVVLDRPLLEATAEDVQLVVVGGRPRYGDPRHAPLFAATGVACEELRVGESTKLVVAPLASVARRIVSDWPEAGRILGGAPSSVGGTA